jgi:hypothetical protein
VDPAADVEETQPLGDPEARRIVLVHERPHRGQAERAEAVLEQRGSRLRGQALPATGPLDVVADLGTPPGNSHEGRR